MTKELSLACIQLNGTPDRKQNLKEAEILIRQAADHGAEFISLPEYTDLMVDHTAKRLNGAEEEESNSALRFYRELAAELGVWIHVGSLGILIGEGRLTNRSFLINDSGDIVARYDKKYLFDVNLPDGQTFKESAYITAGSEDQFIVAPTPWGKVGLAICFDLRFPVHFQGLVRAGAEIILVPSAYSVPTGQESWHVFLRARATETMSFVVAAGQCGVHEGTRQTFGHSMVVGPDGRIMAEADDRPGIVSATLNLAEIDRRRACFPTIKG